MGNVNRHYAGLAAFADAVLSLHTLPVNGGLHVQGGRRTGGTEEAEEAAECANY